MAGTDTAQMITYGDHAKLEADLAASREKVRILRSYLDQAVERMDYLEGIIVELGGSDRL